MKLEELELSFSTSRMMIETLRFYSDPTTYVGIVVLGACDGPLRHDHSETDAGLRAGKRARDMLLFLDLLVNKEKEMTVDRHSEGLTVDREREVPEQINTLRSQVENASSWLDNLTKALGPVLVSDYADQGGETKEDGCDTDLGNDIKDIRLSVVHIARTIERLTERVQL